MKITPIVVVAAMGLGFLTFAARVKAAVPAGCTSVTNGGHEYAICVLDKTWDAARLSCQSAGMTLVRIDNSTENLFVRLRLPLGGWIGANDRANEGAWVWSDNGDKLWSGNFAGTPVGGLYSNWAPFEPNDLLGQDCARIDGIVGQWTDENCGLLKDYACERTIDLCPTDPAKTEPGKCGCGVPDVDSDGDLTPDCLDQCPADPSNVKPGDCGCVGQTNLRPSGAVCFDGPCGAANQCDGAGRCGNAAQCVPDGNCQLKTFEGHAYLFCTTDRTWDDARASCRRVPGMDLVHIDNAGEDAFVAANIGHVAWIGGDDQSVEGTWVWANDNTPFWLGGPNGAPVGGRYENWQNGEPDDSTTLCKDGQDCALHMGTQNHSQHSCGYKNVGGWVSEKCIDKQDYVCEEVDKCAAPTCTDIGAQCGSVMDGCGHIANCGSCADGDICSGHHCEKPGPQVPNTLNCSLGTAFGEGEVSACNSSTFPRKDGDFSTDGFHCAVDGAHAAPTTLLNTNQQLTTTFTGSGAATQTTGIAQSPTALSASGCLFQECGPNNTPIAGTEGSNPAEIAKLNAPPAATDTCAPSPQPDPCPVDPASLIVPPGTVDPSLIADTCDPNNDTCPGDTKCSLVCKEIACKDETEFAYHCGLRYKTCDFTELPSDGRPCAEVNQCTDPGFVGVTPIPGPVTPRTEGTKKGDPNPCCLDSPYRHPNCGDADHQTGTICAANQYLYGEDIANDPVADRCILDVKGGIKDELQSIRAHEEQRPDKSWGMNYMPVLVNNVFLKGRPFGQDFLSLDEGAEWVVNAKVFGQRIELMNLTARAKLDSCQISGTTTARVFGQTVDVFPSDKAPGEDFPKETPSTTIAACKKLYEMGDDVANTVHATGASLLNDVQPVVDVPDAFISDVNGIVTAGNQLKKAFFNAREMTKSFRDAASMANQWTTQPPTRQLCKSAVAEFYADKNGVAIDDKLHQAIDAARTATSPPLGPQDFCDSGAFNPAVATEIVNAWIRDYQRKANQYLQKLSDQIRMLSALQAKDLVQIEGPEDQQFLHESAQFRFPIGPLSLLVEVEASGSWGVQGQLSYEISPVAAPPPPPPTGIVPDPRATLDAPCSPTDATCNTGQPHFSAAFGIVPHVSANARAFLGLEIGNDLLGADVGIEGRLKLIEIKTPMNAGVDFRRHAEPDRRAVGLDFGPEGFAVTSSGTCNPTIANPNTQCTAAGRTGGKCTRISPTSATVGACVYDDDREAAFLFKAVLYNWDLRYKADSQVIVATMDGDIDVRARVKIALFSKTFRKKLASWTGYHQTVDLIGAVAPGENGASDNHKLTPAIAFPDLGGFEMQLRFPKIPELPPIPATITHYADLFPGDPDKESRVSGCLVHVD